MYAVIKSGGKQYKVAENEVIKIEKIDGEVGKNVKFDQVLALVSDKGTQIGEPVISGAVISAEVLEQKKDTKVIIFKKRRRQNSRRKNGHRQQVTVVRILDVSGKGEIKKAPAKKVVAVKSEDTQEAPAPEKTKKAPAEKKATAKKDVGTPKKATAKKED